MRRLLFTVIGSMFAVLAIIEFKNGMANHVCLSHAILFCCGSLLAFLTIVPRFPSIILRALLVFAVVDMAAFFALFFIQDFSFNYLTSSMPGLSLHLMFLLMSAFCMSTVVAHYSCRLKVGGCQSYFEETPSYSSGV